MRIVVLTAATVLIVMLPFCTAFAGGGNEEDPCEGCVGTILNESQKLLIKESCCHNQTYRGNAWFIV